MTLFNIEVIPENNLIYVQSCGYGSEIFRPEIVDGVIHLNNVIPKRRKSSTVLGDSINKINIIDVKTLKNSSLIKLKSDSGIFNSTANKTPKGAVLSAQSSLASSGYFSTSSVDTPPAIRICSKAPAKHSTPVQMPDIVSEQSFTPLCKNFLTSSGKQHKILSRLSSSQIAPNPIAPQSLTKPKQKIIPLSSLGPNLKIVKLFRNPIGNTPQNIAKIVHISNTPKKSSTTFATPAKSTRKLPGPVTPGTVTKWRKCITPAKTYSKRGNIQRKQVIIRSAKKTGLPLYIPNPTVGIVGSAEVEVKTIRAAIDERTTIGPKEFKKQLQSSDDLKNTYSIDIKTKEEYYQARFTAFDLLVNPIRKRPLSKKLHQMFQTKCTKKTAPVEPRFKPILDDIPPLDRTLPARKRFTL